MPGQLRVHTNIGIDASNLDCWRESYQLVSPSLAGPVTQKRYSLVFISGRTVESWYGDLVQAQIHCELSAVVCHVAKKRFVEGHVSRCVEQNPASHNEAPRPLEALVGCSLKGLAKLNEPIAKRLEQLNSVFEDLGLEWIGGGVIQVKFIALDHKLCPAGHAGEQNDSVPPFGDDIWLTVRGRTP